MGKITNNHGNIEVHMSFDELMEKGFPQGFAILDLSTPVPELLGGNLEDYIPFSKAVKMVAARIVREVKPGYNDKMPSRANIELIDGEVVITLGDWG